MAARFTTFLLSIAASMSAMGAAADTAGDADRGGRIFKKCAGCHMLGEKARNRVGPVLNNIMMARAGRVADFRYSKAMIAAGEDGLHWTAETLDAFLAAPKNYVPGTKMSYRGLREAEDRADIIAYLATFSADEMAVRVDAEFTVAPEILALEGDIAYGEYLSSECTTCHQSDGENDGIPGIVGWSTDVFVTAMHAYREKHRDNPVMQLVAGRLADDEIAALALYFSSLGE